MSSISIRLQEQPYILKYQKQKLANIFKNVCQKYKIKFKLSIMITIYESVYQNFHN